MKSVHDLNDAQVSEIVQMALSDHVAFADIEHQYGLKEKGSGRVDAQYLAHWVLSGLA